MKNLLALILLLILFNLNNAILGQKVTNVSKTKKQINVKKTTTKSTLVKKNQKNEKAINYLVGFLFFRIYENDDINSKLKFYDENSGLLTNEIYFGGKYNVVKIPFTYLVSLDDKLTIKYDKSQMPSDYEMDEDEYYIKMEENGGLLSTHKYANNSAGIYGPIKYYKQIR